MQNLKQKEMLPFGNNGGVTNSSNYRLSDNEVTLLKNGRYFEILQAKLNKENILVSFENKCNVLTLNMKEKETTDGIVSQLSLLANSYHSYYEPAVSTFKKTVI